MFVEVLATTNPFALRDADSYRAEADTVADVMTTLPDALRNSEHTRVWVNGIRVGNDASLSDGDKVVVTTLPGFEIGAGFAYTILEIGIQISIAATLSYASYLLFKPSEPPKKKDDESSSAYNFTGITQNRTAHQPIEHHLGEFRSGGTVIGEYIRSTYAPVTSTLYQLVSFGWGPFKSIAGLTEDTPEGVEIVGNMLAGKIFINDNPIENYDDVYVQVRLGSNTQKAIPGFEQLIVPIAVGPFEMTSEESNLLSNSSSASTWNPLVWEDATNDGHYDLYARSFDVTTAYDELVLRLRASGGYYSSDSSGSLLPSSFQYQVRYRELDVSNNPITTGGANGDGWYREPPNSGVGFPTFQQTGLFDYEIRIPLRDPQIGTVPTPGNSLLVPSDGTLYVNADVVPANSPGVAGSAFTLQPGNEGFSVSFWFKPVGNIAVGESVYLVGSEDNPATNGFTVWIQAQLFEGNLLITPRIRFWSHTVDVVLNHAVNMGQWNHFAFTWNKSVFAFYSILNLNYSVTQVGVSFVPSPTWANQPLNVGGSTANPTFKNTASGVTVEYDVIRVYLGYLTTGQLFSLGHEATSPSVLQSAPWINSEWKVQLAVDPNTAVPASGAPGQLWATLDSTPFGGTSIVAGGGLIPSFEQGEFKKMKARLEIVRTNIDSTNIGTNDKIEWVEVQGVEHSTLSYPNHALLAYRIESSEQLGGRLPNTSCINEGLLVLVWDGASTTNPGFTLQYSKNPAWHAVSMIQGDPLSRLPGNYKAVLPTFLAWANYCDEIVYNGTPLFITTGTAANFYAENLWYDNTVEDEFGHVRGAFILHIAYRDQTSGEVLNGSLPSEYVPGGYIRLRGWPDAATLGGDHELNTPADSDKHGAGGYEIYEVGVDPGTVVSTYGPAYHVVRFYACPPGGTPPNSVWPGQGGGDEGDLTESLGNAVTGSPYNIGAGYIVEGGERRFEFNGVYDTSRGGWDALKELCAVGRAAPIREGRRIRVRYSHPTTPVTLISQAVIEKGSFKIAYADPGDRPNAFEFQFRNRSRQFDNDTAAYIDGDLLHPDNQNEVRRDDRELFGTTSYGQASRQARYEANVNRLLLRVGEFRVPPIGINLEVGDTARLSSDLLPRGTGGMCNQAPTTSPTLLRDGDDLSTSNWTKSNVTVTVEAVDEIGNTTYTVDDTSAAALGVVYQDSVSAFTATPGPYCLSAIVGNSAGGTNFRLELQHTSDPTKYYWAHFDLTGAGSIVSENKLVDGGARITRLVGDSYFCTIWFKFFPGIVGDRIRAIIAPAVGSSGIDVTDQSAKAVSAVTLVEGKRPLHLFAGANRAVTLDAAATIPAGSLLHAKNDLDELSSGVVLTGSATSFVAGDTVFLNAPGLDFPLGRHDQYLFVETGSELVVEVVSTKLQAGLVTLVEFIEYHDDVFLDRSSDQTELVISNDDHGGISALRGQSRVPGHVSIENLRDWLVRVGQGVYTTNLRVAWTPVTADRWLLTENRIWARRSGVGGSRWQLLGTSAGPDASAEVVLPFAAPGLSVDVAVQPVTRSGVARNPERCAWQAYTLQGYATPPSAPTSVENRVQARYARHTWTLESSDRHLSVECRRGGWVLGYRVFTSAPGADFWGTSRDWSGSDTATTTLFYRTLGPGNTYSRAVGVTTDPTPDLDPQSPDVTDVSKAWETFAAAGWEPSSPAIGDPEIGAGFVQDAQGALRWDVGAVGTTEAQTVWTSRETTKIPTSGEPRREARMCFVEAYWEAMQLHPQTWDGLGDWPLADARDEAWTWEGPPSPASGSDEVRLWMEVNINETGRDGGWTGWHRFQPGYYALADIVFRIRATRPDVSYGFILSKVHTRVTAPALTIEQATPVRRRLEVEIM